MSAWQNPRPRTAVPSDRRALRRAAATLVVAGLAFALYPALRGSGSEEGAAGAALYARDAWLVAHTLGMVGFVAAAWGLTRLDRRAGSLAMAGAVLVLPYYGAETFGLHALGRRVLETGDHTAIAAADLFRYHPVAMTTFAAGLLLLAAAGVRVLALARHGLGGHHVGLALTGLGLVAYLPQFFVPIEGRIAHGIVLGIGLLALAGAIHTRTRATDEPLERISASA